MHLEAEGTSYLFVCSKLSWVHTVSKYTRLVTVYAFVINFSSNPQGIKLINPVHIYVYYFFPVKFNCMFNCTLEYIYKDGGINTFICVLKWRQLGAHYFLVYLFQLLYMFRATVCPSSGDVTVQMRHWYFSLCIGGCLVFWLGWDSFQPTDQAATDTVSSPDDGHTIARNMYRSWNKYTKKYCAPSWLHFKNIIREWTVNKT